MSQASGGDWFAPVPPKAAPASSGVTWDERRALARIVTTSDLIRLPDGREFLLTPAPAELVDTLAAFDAGAEDMEDEGEALDWTWGRPVMGRSGDRLFPVVIQDGEQDPTQWDGGSR